MSEEAAKAGTHTLVLSDEAATTRLARDIAGLYDLVAKAYFS